jgi:hypothetical protein
MALDTNIALGVKPIEQVNMLGQMGQMMQLRQANDEYQSNNALKDFYAQGGDLSKPEDQRRLMSTVGAKGADLIAKQYALQKTKEEVKKLGYDNVESEFKQSRALLSSIDPSSPNAGAQLMAWHEANHRNPVMSSILAASGIDAASSRASLQAAIAKGPAGIQEAIRRSAIGQADYQKELMQTERSHISAAPGHRQASVAEQKWAQEQKQQAEVDALMRGGTPSATPMTFSGGGGSSIMNPAPTNALIQGATPALSPNMMRPDAQAPALAPAPAPAPAPTGDLFAQIKALDAKIAPLVNSGNPRATAIVQQLIAQRTQLLASAKQQYGGQLTTMEVPDPRTGRPTVVQARPNQYGELEPVEMKPVPLSTNAGGNGSTEISPTVARPAPTAAVVKERQATEKLPEAIAMNNDAIRKIDEMIGGVDAKGNPLKGTAGQAHPGLSKATGLGGGVMRFFAGTEGKNFEIRHKEVLSQAFLDAFEALKGGGSITEKEGEKATAARTRMDLAQSKEEYVDAAREYQGVLKRGVENARARMQRSGTGLTPASGSGAALTGEDKAAMDWANANPKDPRAAQIRQRLGG